MDKKIHTDNSEIFETEDIDEVSELHPELTAVAFAYDYQVLPEISCESFDERPDQLLTPSEIYSFMENNKYD